MQLKKMIMETVPARFDGRDCWVMWHKINDEIIPAINELLTNTPPNEPLTLEQLMEMDSIPIWVVDTITNRQEWCYWKDELAYSCEDHPQYYDPDEYGLWLAYRRPKEGES